MRHVRVNVKRDQNTVTTREIPEWEVPVLEMIFEDGNVQRIDGETAVDREYPGASFEFDRLVRAYGADPQSGVPYVAAVYGQAQAGIRALARAIDAARDEEKEAAPAASPFITSIPPDANQPRDALLA